MADQVQLRRGTAAQIATFTGAVGEVTPSTDTNRLYVHDGVTPGGHPHAMQNELIVTCTDSSGAANAVIIASNIGPAAPVDGMVVVVKIANTSTGACTINYNAAGAVALVAGTGAALVPGALQGGAEIIVQYRAALPGYVLLANNGANPQFASALPISQGGTGATTAAGAVANLGLTEALVFAGTWNASTNSPALASGAGTPGAVYVVSVAGTTTLDGTSQWNVGDKAAFNGVTSAWTKIDGVPNEVLSVNGATGAVVVQPQIPAAAGLILGGPTITGGNPVPVTIGSNLSLSGTTLQGAQAAIPGGLNGEILLGGSTLAGAAPIGITSLINLSLSGTTLTASQAPIPGSLNGEILLGGATLSGAAPIAVTSLVNLSLSGTTLAASQAAIPAGSTMLLAGGTLVGAAPILVTLGNNLTLSAGTLSAVLSTGSQIFLSSGSGNIPSSAKQFRILGVGGGASGAGGGTVSSSGSGGASGGTALIVDTGWLPTSILSTLSFSVLVGAGGAQAAAGAAGNAGSDSTVTFGSTVFTFFGASTSTQATAGASAAASTGGTGGGHLGAFTVSANNSASGRYYAGRGGTGCSSTGAPVVNSITVDGPSSGGAGGGLSSGTASAGGAGSNTYIALLGAGLVAGGAAGAAGGGAGGAGVSNANWPYSVCGTGGGGGGGNASGVGGAGGVGGQPGGSGGGGGSGTGGGGVGGAGGAGAVFVEWV